METNNNESVDVVIFAHSDAIWLTLFTPQLFHHFRPGSIQTQKQKEFVYHFERCHWDTLQVFPMPRTHAKYSTAAVLAYSGPFSRTESRTEMKSFDSLATLGTSSLRRSESDNLSRSNHSPNLSQATNSVSSSAKRASITLNLIETPNESEKNALIKKNKTMSSDRSFDHVHKVGSHENILSISDKATKSPSLTDSPPLHKIEIIQENVPLSSHIILGSPKSISQSISDQQYSLPLIGRETDNSSGCHVNNNDTAANNSSNIPNGIYNNDRKAGSNENMWCHQLVILCTSALKQSLTPGNIVTERNCGRFDDTYSKINLLRCRKSLVDISTAMSGGVSVSVQVNMIGEVLPDNTDSYIDDDGNLRLNPTNDEENDDNLLSSATDGYNIDKKDNSKPKESRNHNVVDKSFNVFNAYITTLKTEINGGKWDTIRYISEKLHEYFECDEAALTARRSSSSGSSTAGRRTSIKNLLDIQEMKMMIELNEMKNRDLLESSLNNIDSDAHDDLDSDIIAALKNSDCNSGTSIDDDKIMDDIINYDGDSRADNHFDQSAVCGNDDDYEESDYGVSTPILSQNCSLEFLAANADTNGNEDDDDSIDEEEEAKDGITIITRLLLEYIDTRADTIFDDVMIKEISTIWKDFHRNNSNLADDDPIGDLNAGMTDKSKIKSHDKVGGNNLNVKVIDGGNSLRAVFSDLNKLFSNSGIKR